MLELAFSIFFIVIGLMFLSRGADFLVGGAARIAKKIKIPEIVIGLTIVAIGTSLPELIISVTSALQGEADITISNVIGSNFANLFLIICLCAVIKPLHINKQTRTIDQPLVVLATLVLFIMIQDGVVSRIEGYALLCTMVGYLFYTIVASFWHPRFLNDDDKVNIPLIKTRLLNKTRIGKRIKVVSRRVYSRVPILVSLLVIALGAFLLKIGGDFTIDGVKQIAVFFNIPSKIIGFTILAFGTSLPELITCIKATRAGESDLAIGNIVGSQLFNIILVLGSASVITNINVESSFFVDLFILLIGNIIFMIVPGKSKNHQIGRICGLAFVLFYIVYIAYKCIVRA